MCTPHGSTAPARARLRARPATGVRQCPDIWGSAYCGSYCRRSAGLVLTARNMAAKRRRAAALDRTHNLQLAEAHMAGVGLTPRRSEVAEDIRDFESGTNHEYRSIVADQAFCWLAV